MASPPPELPRGGRRIFPDYRVVALREDTNVMPPPRVLRLRARPELIVYE